MLGRWLTGLRKCEDLGSEPKHLQRKSDVTIHASNPFLGMVDTGGLLACLVGVEGSGREGERRPCLKGECGGEHLVFSSGCRYVSVHTGTRCAVVGFF